MRLAEILLNLIDNGVRYGEPGGHVEISWRRPEPDRVRISVRDSAPGITPEHLERLFTPFDRLDRHSGEGTGLGLYLCKTLSEAMGGTISAASVTGEGSTIWFELAGPSPPDLPRRLRGRRGGLLRRRRGRQ